MSVKPSLLSFQQFEEAHQEEITAISLILAKITSLSLEEVKPSLDAMLWELVKGQVSSFDIQRWEADMQLLAEGSEHIPVLSEEAFTRESIY